MNIHLNRKKARTVEESTTPQQEFADEFQADEKPRSPIHGMSLEDEVAAAEMQAAQQLAKHVYMIRGMAGESGRDQAIANMAAWYRQQDPRVVATLAAVMLAEKARL